MLRDERDWQPQSPEAPLMAGDAAA